MQRDNSYHLFGLGRVLGLDHDGGADDLQQESKQKDHGEGWKEFKKGRSTPVTLCVPANHLQEPIHIPSSSRLLLIYHQPIHFRGPASPIPFVVLYIDPVLLPPNSHARLP